MHVQAQHARAFDDEEEDAPGESHDQYIMRRTKEFNIAVREKSHDLQLWLDYAAFQDETSRYGQCYYLRVRVSARLWSLGWEFATVRHIAQSCC